MKRTRLILLSFLFLTACAQRGEMMTRESYAMVNTGTPISDIEKKYGKPIRIFSTDDGEVYEYMERMLLGRETLELRRYFFVVVDGKVKEKYFKFDNPPPYEAIYSDDPYPNY